MPTIELDSTLKRTTVEGLSFPLGVYPVEPMTPVSGFYSQFEAADGAEPFLTGGEEAFDDWEAWPDRYMFDVLIDAGRLPALVRAMLTLLPPRVYPILDVLGHDAYREIDPYVSYDPVGLDKIIEAQRVYADWLYEDGLVGFGAMSIEPFIYVFVDEHKIVTVRVELEMREKVEELLAAFEIPSVEEIVGSDSAAHEHRSVLYCPPDRPDLFTPEEIVERLRRDWLLQLNVPGDTNLDDDGNELGVTPWRCVVRCIPADNGPERYAEVFLRADSLDRAEQLATDATIASPPDDRTPSKDGPDDSDDDGWIDIDPVQCDRVREDDFNAMLQQHKFPRQDAASAQGVVHVVWHGRDERSERD